MSEMPLSPPSTAANAPSQEPIDYSALKKYTACDISDALLNLPHPTHNRAQHHLAGFLCDIVPRNPTPPGPGATVFVGPSFTVQFQPQRMPGHEGYTRPEPGASKMPPGAIWSDLAERDSIVVVQQPEGQRSAVVGGIHMQNLRRLGVRALVVDGRIRDRREIAGLDMPVCSKGTSVVAAKAESVPCAVQVPVVAAGVCIEPGDVVMVDLEEGVVSIPRAMVAGVLRWLEARGDGEDRAMDAVKSGSTVKDAFKAFR